MSELRQPSREKAGPAAPPELARLRERIDAIDAAILAKLNERAEAVLEVGRLKGTAAGAPAEPSARTKRSGRVNLQRASSLLCSATRTSRVDAADDLLQPFEPVRFIESRCKLAHQPDDGKRPMVAVRRARLAEGV